MKKFWRPSWVAITTALLMAPVAWAQGNSPLLFFEVENPFVLDSANPPDDCAILWWNEDLSHAYQKVAILSAGTDKVYGVAERPDVSEQAMFSYVMVCKDENGGSRPVAIRNGRTLLDAQVQRASLTRKETVAAIHNGRVEHDAVDQKVKTLRSNLAGTIPTDDIIEQRQDKEKLEAEIKVLLAEKTVLDSALKNLDFKRAESDVFFSSERVLQQYIQDEQHQVTPRANSNRKTTPPKH